MLLEGLKRELNGTGDGGAGGGEAQRRFPGDSFCGDADADAAGGAPDFLMVVTPSFPPASLILTLCDPCSMVLATVVGDPL